MAKNLRFFFFFSLIINSYISQNNDLNEENSKFRFLASNNLFHNISQKDAMKLKFHYKLSQTVYTDLLSKNYYFTTFYITESKRRQTYLIDTGSDIMSSTCQFQPNLNSFKNNYIFNNKTSLTKLKCGSKICDMLPSTKCEENKDEKNNICSFDSSNNKNSNEGIKGYYIQDIAYMEEQYNYLMPLKSQQRKKYHSYEVPIGCTTEEYGKYKDMKVDGVLGVNNNPKSFVGLLYKLKIIKNDMFSLCFGPRGGYMSLGEIDFRNHHDRFIQYVPFIESDNFYYQIKINCFSFKNKENPNNNTYIKAETIAQINTGYNITYLPEKLYDELIQEFNNYCNKNGECGTFKEYENLGFCASFSDRETLFDSLYRHWPELILYLDNNSTYIWKPFNFYFYHHDNLNETRFACLGFNKHNSKEIILGTNFMHGYDIIFDRKEKKLGFARADCTKGNHLRRSHLNRNFNGINEEERVRESIKRFHSRFNRTEDDIDFIRGTNRELHFSSNLKLINYILLSVSIIILIIVAVSVISLLICNKKTGLRYEEPDVVIDHEIDNYKNDEDAY